MTSSDERTHKIICNGLLIINLIFDICLNHILVHFLTYVNLSLDYQQLDAVD